MIHVSQNMVCIKVFLRIFPDSWYFCWTINFVPSKKWTRTAASLEPHTLFCFTFVAPQRPLKILPDFFLPYFVILFTNVWEIGKKIALSKKCNWKDICDFSAQINLVPTFTIKKKVFAVLFCFNTFCSYFINKALCSHITDASCFLIIIELKSIKYDKYREDVLQLKKVVLIFCFFFFFFCQP